MVQPIAEVGGTKDPDVSAIFELRPDLVVMNQEENVRSVAEKLEDARIPVLVTFPKRVGDGLAQVGRLARALGDIDQSARDIVRDAYQAYREACALKQS